MPAVRALIAVLASCLLACGTARAAEDVSVDTQRKGEAVEIHCSATIEAAWDVVWQTLTDYGRLAEFIPGMRRSRIVSYVNGAAVVEQVGEARFLFVAYPIEVTLSSVERAPDTIEARMLKGNLTRMEGAYRVQARPEGRIRLTWDGLIEAPGLPPLIGELVMRANIEDQFRGMVREIERREALRRERAARPQ